jgi:hypothetical protein
MNQNIANLNARLSTFRQVRGDRNEIERLASVRYEETPAYDDETEEESDFSDSWVSENERDVVAELFPYRNYDRASLAMEEGD